MANNWNIPESLEEEVRLRDKNCVYCNVEFTPAEVSKKTSATWEHIINDAKIITRENIALCCSECNSSKSNTELLDWLDSSYCKAHGINKDSVAPVIKQAISKAQ